MHNYKMQWCFLILLGVGPIDTGASVNEANELSNSEGIPNL